MKPVDGGYPRTGESQLHLALPLKGSKHPAALVMMCSPVAVQYGDFSSHRFITNMTLSTTNYERDIMGNND